MAQSPWSSKDLYLFNTPVTYNIVHNSNFVKFSFRSRNIQNKIIRRKYLNTPMTSLSIRIICFRKYVNILKSWKIKGRDCVALRFFWSIERGKNATTPCRQAYIVKWRITEGLMAIVVKLLLNWGRIQERPRRQVRVRYASADSSLVAAGTTTTDSSAVEFATCTT